MFIDVHAHLNDDKLIENVEQILEDASKVGVKKVICCGYDEKSSIVALELSKKFDCIYACIGMHPHDSKYYTEEFENWIKLNHNDSKVVAIGEIGLDYHYDLSPRETQKEIFVRQIRLASELKLPIVIHTREAIADTLQILKENKQFLNNKILFHCYNASLEITKELLKFDSYFSFGGTITFKNATNLVEVVKFIPLDRILLETDCPYLAPQPLRGSVNEPKNIPLIAEKLAEIKGVNIETISKQTLNNTKKFFNIG